MIAGKKIAVFSVFCLAISAVVHNILLAGVLWGEWSESLTGGAA